MIHIDGGSRGNPGPSGFGVHAVDREGQIVAEHFGFIGVATNNVAEYRALVHAFRLASARGARHIEIRSDSELVVKQMNGVYKVKHPDMITLWRQASTLRRGFDAAEINHVRREFNKKADTLANQAMDLRESHLND
ncbi:MAG: ribonuclease HI family protein [Vicinamibacteria bacterium]|nr:ribonuclease HI family protein [Vicinamibacteria bacterium]